MWQHYKENTTFYFVPKSHNLVVVSIFLHGTSNLTIKEVCLPIDQETCANNGFIVLVGPAIRPELPSPHPCASCLLRGNHRPCLVVDQLVPYGLESGSHASKLQWRPSTVGVHHTEGQVASIEKPSDLLIYRCLGVIRSLDIVLVHMQLYNFNCVLLWRWRLGVRSLLSLSRSWNWSRSDIAALAIMHLHSITLGWHLVATEFTSSNCFAITYSLL